jgi:tRNA G37 N-methylase Trm5
MRHLRVPSTETAQWRERLTLAGWLAAGAGIQSDGDHRLLPLNELAPADGNAGFEGHAIVRRPSLRRGPQHWRERLDPSLLAAMEPFLPAAHEVQGDVLLVKLEPEVEAHEKAIAEAMLAQFSHVRVVCVDGGVTGPFRIRDLRVLAARGADASTETTVREHGLDYTLDPATAYFSARLSREREGAMTLIKAHQAHLGRRLIAHDPYAGVGPNLGLPLQDGAIEVAVAGDLNGQAVPYLRSNLSRIIGKSAHPEARLVVREGDGREWQHDPSVNHQADVLFVNLPHEGMDHLADLIPLLADDALVLGWALVDRHQEEAVAGRVRAVFDAAGWQADVDVQATKGFSTTRTMVRLVVRATTGS